MHFKAVTGIKHCVMVDKAGGGPDSRAAESPWDMESKGPHRHTSRFEVLQIERRVLDKQKIFPLREEDKNFQSIR